MRTLLSSAVVVGIFVAYSASVGLGQSRASRASVEGVWEPTTSGMNGKITNPKRLPGLQIFTRGYYSVLMQDGRNAAASARQPLPPLKTADKPTDAEKIARADHWAPVVAQSGTYEVKGNMLMQHVTVNKTAERGMPTYQFRLEDNGNTLRLTSADGVVTTYRRLE